MYSIATPTRLRRASATVAAAVMIMLAGSAVAGVTAHADSGTDAPPAQAQPAYLQVVPVEPWPFFGWYNPYGYSPYRMYYWPGMFGSA